MEGLEESEGRGHTNVLFGLGNLLMVRRFT